MARFQSSGFHRSSPAERRQRLADWAELSPADLDVLEGSAGLGVRAADRMVENAIGVHGLPLGVAVHLEVNGVEAPVLMAVEEPSVVAAASFGAKLLKAGGGITAVAAAPLMSGQLQLLEVPDVEGAKAAILAEREALLELANGPHERLRAAGGGAVDIELYRLPATQPDDPLPEMLVMTLWVKVGDAMGANAINSMCERLAPKVAALSGGRVGLRILSNLSDRRLVRATGRVPISELSGRDGGDGARLADGVVEASVFAERDPYRAATHNKGIMNGVDAVLLAYGQDWRAVEAGAHAYAARDGRYTALARWRRAGDFLEGELELPMAVGTVGGVAKVHPTVQLARKISGVESASRLAELTAAAGLAQNLSALRALAGAGIQSGHMRLHARNLAVEVGARGAEVQAVATQIADLGKVNLGCAKEVLQGIRDSRAASLSVQDEFKALTETALPKILALIEEVSAAASPEGSSLLEMCRYHFASGGKRLRALLPMMVATALGEEEERALPFGACCEMLHNATLVHDDLQDGDTTRRGVETVWSKFGRAQAINLGDAMFYYTLLIGMQVSLPPAEKERVLRRVLVETLRVIDGQEREFSLKSAPAPQLEDYFRMVEGKTSGLFSLPMAGAAELYGAAPDLVAQLAAAAGQLGVLFQIQDDLLDLYGDKGRDEVGSDLKEGKRSALVVHALTHASPEQAARLSAVLDAPREQTSAEDVQFALSLFEDVGSKAFALSELSRRRAAAVRAVSGHAGLSALVEGLAELFLKPIAGLLG